MTRQLRPVPDTPLRAIALIRVSKVGDRGDDLTSPEIQRTLIGNYAAQRGYVVVEWVEALDESASSRRSPWWAKLDAAIGKIEAGDAEVIVVWRLSRAARNRRRWAVAIDRVDVAGGLLESATEPIDSSTSTGRLTRGMLAELAAWEADVKSEVWKETVDRRRREGLAHTTYPRLGYRIVDRRYVVAEDTAPIVVACFRRYVSGDGYRQVAGWLNATGVPQPRSGGVWTAKTLARMLDSGFAAGLIRVGDGYLPGAHPAVVDEGLWARYLRARRRRSVTPERLQEPVTCLSTLVRCGSCGRALRVKRGVAWSHGRKTDRPRRLIFACETPGCRRHTYVSVARATEAVLEWLRPIAADVDVSAATLAADSAARTVAKAQRRQLVREVARLEAALTRLTKDLASGLVLPGDYASARDELAGERRRAVAALDALAEVVERPAPSRRMVARLLDGWDGLDDLARRRALGEVVWKAVVSPPLPPGGPSRVEVFGVWERQ